VSKGNARSIVEGFVGTQVLVLGDVMVDAYLWGKVDRISPEAPVPVVHVTKRSARLGGAANVARNLYALGAKPLVVSMVGDDDNASIIEKLLRDEDLSVEGVAEDHREDAHHQRPSARGARG
jgi:rfaE bifunctional protein kinase chain/domain